MRDEFKKNGGFGEVKWQLLLIFIGAMFFGGIAALWGGIEDGHTVWLIIGAVIVALYAIGFAVILFLFLRKYLKDNKK